MTVINDQNMNCEIKVTVNMKLQGGETFKLDEVLYLPQLVNNILSVSRLVSKESTMGDNKDKTTNKKGGSRMTLDARKKTRSQFST